MDSSPSSRSIFQVHSLIQREISVLFPLSVNRTFKILGALCLTMGLFKHARIN